MKRNEPTKKHCLNVYMLGEFSITYDGKPITLPMKIYSKPTELFILMAYFGEKGITRQKVMESLYNDDAILDGTGNLRVVAFRLRRQLIELKILGENDKINDKGIFHLNQEELEVRTDAGRFEELIRCSTEEGENTEAVLREACSLYRGEFLGELSSNLWVAGKQVWYRDRYFECVYRYLTILEEQKNYDEMLQLIQFVTRMYPYEEWYLKEIDILIRTEQWKEARETTERAIKEMMTKMGVHPSKEMNERLEIIQEHLIGSYKSLQDIRDKLLDENDHEGATYFNYNFFVETYRYEIRKMERNGLPVCLALYTLKDGHGENQKEGILTFDQKMDLLGESIRVSLRRTDIYTRYAQNQYLILLYGVRKEDCPSILERVDRRFRKISGSRKDELYTSIIPAQWDAICGGSISAELHYSSAEK